MCGLFGVHSVDKLSQLELDRMGDLAVLSATRGTHSSGIAIGARRKGKPRFKMKKMVNNTVSLLTDYNVHKALHEDDTFLVVGHARHATSGRINERNAHPIHEGSIIGTHNGTITAFEPPKGQEENLSDSRILYQKVDQEGLLKALKDARTGAWAMVYIDVSNGTLNFVRNSARPLWYMYNTSGRTIYWASTREMLNFLAESHGASSFRLPTMFPVDVHHTINLHSKSADIKSKELKLWESSIILGHPPWSIDDYTEENNKDTGSTTSVPVTKSTVWFCKSCRCRVGQGAARDAGPDECKCDTPKYYSPVAWEIDDKGKLRESAAARPGEGKGGGQKPTLHLPGLGAPSPSSPVGKAERKFNADQDHQDIDRYRWFEYGYLTPDDAKDALAVGCENCKVVNDLDATSWWFAGDGYYCNKCYNVEEWIKEMFHGKNRGSIWKSAFFRAPKRTKH